VRRALLDRLACPRTGAPYVLDPVRVAGDEVVEGFLVSTDAREVRPLVAGVAVLPQDLRAHLDAHGSVYRRTPVNDPRLARFLLADIGTGHDRVPFEMVVGHYRDLASDPPPGYTTDRHPDDVALAELLDDALGTGRAPGLGVVLGCGVGRGVFDLVRHVEAALGLDRSIACVRRARNIAVTNEHFFLPAPPGSGLGEIALDLATLERLGADFAVADPHALPLRAGAADVLVCAAQDGKGPWPDADAAVAEARRVLAPGGLLVWHVDLDAHVALEATRATMPFRAAVVP
jgi:uncharacterized protein YbaR (Trm112 family)